MTFRSWVVDKDSPLKIKLQKIDNQTVNAFLKPFIELFRRPKNPGIHGKQGIISSEHVKVSRIEKGIFPAPVGAVLWECLCAATASFAAGIEWTVLGGVGLVKGQVKAVLSFR